MVKLTLDNVNLQDLRHQLSSLAQILTYLDDHGLMKPQRDHATEIMDTLAEVVNNRHIFLDLITKEWFDKTHEESFCSACVTIDGIVIVRLPYQRGMGDQAMDAVIWSMSELAGYPDRSTNQTIWDYCTQHKYGIRPIRDRNCLKRDVKALGLGEEQLLLEELDPEETL